MWSKLIDDNYTCKYCGMLFKDHSTQDMIICTDALKRIEEGSKYIDKHLVQVFLNNDGIKHILANALCCSKEKVTYNVITAFEKQIEEMVSENIVDFSYYFADLNTEKLDKVEEPESDVTLKEM